jgi:uncharacterized protein
MINVEVERFVIIKEKNREYKFNFIDKNGNILLKSGSYLQKSMCLNGIESVKRNSQEYTKYSIKRSSTNETYFHLKSLNGRILGISQLFEDKVSLEGGIELLMDRAPKALIEYQFKKKLIVQAL